ncbi:hypothetical protein D3C81_915850 [compost metagenome]
MQRAVDRLLHQATRAGLLHGHADRAVEIRIGGTVDRREVVEVFAGVIQRAECIQRLRVEARQPLVGFVGRLRQQRAFHALRRGLEVVGAVLAHLVEIDLDVGIPAMELRHLRPAVGLCQGKPVAIEIGEVVIDAATGERFDMLLVGRIGRRRTRAPAVVPVGGTVATIRVLRGVDDDDGLIQPTRGFRVLAGGQVVGRQHRGFAAGRFIAVHAVAEPDHCRCVVAWCRLCGIDQCLPLRGDLRAACVVAR